MIIGLTYHPMGGIMYLEGKENKKKTRRDENEKRTKEFYRKTKH